MSKKDTAAPEEKPVVDKKAAAAKAREARDAKAARDTFIYAGESEKKLAPQAQGIVDILKEAGKKGLGRNDLLAAMEGKITTKQPMGRILTYYQKALVEANAVRMNKGTDEEK